MLTDKNRKIILNRIKTPDGTILVSRNRHDYRTHRDQNGLLYMVDGGNDYLRRTVHDVPYEEMSLYTDEPHEVLRQAITWGKRDCNNILWYIPISHMSRAHISNILADGYTGPYIELMKAEIVWRNEHEVSKRERKRMEVQREAGYV